MNALLTPTTQTRYAGIITITSRNLWEMYRDANLLLNVATVAVTDAKLHDQAHLAEWLAAGNTPNWQAVADVFGMSDPEKAAELLMLIGKAFGQVNAEQINGDENFLRVFMHRVG